MALPEETNIYVCHDYPTQHRTHESKVTVGEQREYNIHVKDGISKRFCIIDGAMNDLIRPTLYNAYHKIKPLSKVAANTPNVIMDVVGPICESGDFIARDRKLPMFAEGDFLAIMTSGAYSAAMGSTYNSRPLAPEVLVDGDKYATIRRRLTVDDMLDLECLPSWFKRE